MERGITVSAILLAVMLISAALYAGLKQKRGLVFWRSVKLGSALFGFAGLLLLLINFEKTVWDATTGQKLEQAKQRFLELKVYMTKEIAQACANESINEAAKQRCFDMRRIDYQLTARDFTQGQLQFRMLGEKLDVETDRVIKDVSRRIGLINLDLDGWSEFSLEVYRTKALMISIYLGILALAGSVGEAAFQLGQARAQSKRPATP